MQLRLNLERRRQHRGKRRLEELNQRKAKLQEGEVIKSHKTVYQQSVLVLRCVHRMSSMTMSAAYALSPTRMTHLGRTGWNVRVGVGCTKTVPMTV